MSRKRAFAVKLLLTATSAAGGSLLLGLGGVLVCSTYPTHKPTSPVNTCAAENGHDFQDPPVDDFSDVHWWGSPDVVPDGGVPDGAAGKYVASAPDPTIETIPGGPLCGKYTKAGVFRASHNNDWGCLFGNWQFNDTETSLARDASAWEGLSFWARAPGNTTKGFTILLNDDNTSGNARGHFCRDYGVDGGAAGLPSSTTTINDPSTGTPIVGSSTTRASYPDECGNDYSVVVLVTSDWQFYTIPFSAFQQSATPNRVPNSVFSAGNVPGTGLLTTNLRRLGLRFSKEAEMELWLTGFNFYSKKAN
jgi:hypothetical protein